MFNFSGTVTPNPAGKNATTLTIGFPSYNAKEKIIYPPKEVVSPIFYFYFCYMILYDIM